MLALLFAVATTCATSPDALLEANRKATGSFGASGTANVRYSYEGQGLTGWTSRTYDLATGVFIDESETPPIRDQHGFDGKLAWFRDLSGGFIPQGPNARQALAVSEAYLNSEAWWRRDRGGARIELSGCNRLKVVPPKGQEFEATFDPVTGLLSGIRQNLTFGISAETRMSDYGRHSGKMVSAKIETFTNDDPSTRETMRLASLRIEPARTPSAYAMPTRKPADWLLPPSGRVSLPFRLLNNHVIIEARVNGRGPFPFLLDTGGHNIVTPATHDQLGLASRGESVSGGSGEKTSTNGYVHLDRIDVAGAVLTNQTGITLDFSPPPVEGLQLGGMLGLELLERFVVRIDYGERMVTIMAPELFDEAERQRSGTPVPFTFYEHMPQVIGTLDGRPARLTSTRDHART